MAEYIIDFHGSATVIADSESDAESEFLNGNEEDIDYEIISIEESED